MKLGTHCYLVPDCLLEPVYLLETTEYLYDKNQWYGAISDPKLGLALSLTF